MKYTNVQEISVSYKNLMRVSEIEQITTYEKAIRIFRPIYSDFIDHHEEVWCMYLNRQNNIIGVSQISKGGISGTVVDIRIVLQIALKASASGIILVHNHPSGNLQISNDDIHLTKSLSDACKLMEIKLLDHIILTRHSYVSFANHTSLL